MYVRTKKIRFNGQLYEDGWDRVLTVHNTDEFIDVLQDLDVRQEILAICGGTIDPAVIERLLKDYIAANPGKIAGDIKVFKYQTGVSYKENDMVVSGKALYLAKRDIQDTTQITTDDFIALSGGGSSPSGDPGSFDRTDKTAVAVGGLPANSSVDGMSVKEVLEAILFPYQQPTVSFTISPATNIYEAGNTISLITFNISAGKKTQDIKSIKIYDGSTLVTTITTAVANGGTFNYTYNCSIRNTTTLKVEVSDGTKTASATKEIKFVNKSYYGFVPDGTTIDEAAIKGLQNSVLSTNNRLTYTVTCNDSKIVYAYPQSFGALTSILDSSGFQYISSYNQSTMTINGVAYYVYEIIDPVSLTDFKQIFA